MFVKIIRGKCSTLIPVVRVQWFKTDTPGRTAIVIEQEGRDAREEFVGDDCRVFVLNDAGQTVDTIARPVGPRSDPQPADAP